MNGGVYINLELVDMIVDDAVIGRDAATEFRCASFDFIQQVEDALLLFAADDRVVRQDFINLTHVEAEQRHLAPKLFFLQVNEIAWICRLANLSTTKHHTCTKQRDKYQLQLFLTARIRGYRRIQAFTFHVVVASFRTGGLRSAISQRINYQFSRTPLADDGIDLNQDRGDPTRIAE